MTHVGQFLLQTLRLFVGIVQLLLDLLPLLSFRVQDGVGLIQGFTDVSQRALTHLQLRASRDREKNTWDMSGLNLLQKLRVTVTCMQKAVKRAEEAKGRTNKIQTEEERIVQEGLPLLCLYSSEKENHKGFVPGWETLQLLLRLRANKTA